MAVDTKKFAKDLQQLGGLPGDMAKSIADSVSDSESASSATRTIKSDIRRLKSKPSQERQFGSEDYACLCRMIRKAERLARAAEIKSDRIERNFISHKSKQAQNERRQKSLETVNKIDVSQMSHALSGFAVLTVDGEDVPTNGEITAAALNAADAGTLEITCDVVIADNAAGGSSVDWQSHSWASFDNTPTPAENCVDADIGVPVVEGNGQAQPFFLNGTMRLVIKPDVDAGATKVYAPGDSISVTVDVSGGPSPILSAMASIQKTWDVI